jgi:hypothetical protein
MSYHHARIKLFEIGFNIIPTPGLSIQPLELLNECLSATISLYKTGMATPASEVYSLPFVLYGKCFDAIVSTIRLSLFESHGWDKHFVRKQIDVMSVLEDSAQRLREAYQTYGPRKNVGSFYNTGTKLDGLKQVYEARLARESKEHEESSKDTGHELFPLNFLDTLNDSFWYDLEDYT